MRILQIGDCENDICAECWAQRGLTDVRADVIVESYQSDGQREEYGLCANHAEVANIDTEGQEGL